MIRNALAALRWLRRGVIFVVGATVTIFGVLLVVTPIPAAVLVPVGLMILGTEFAWARVALHWLHEQVGRLKRPGARAPVPALGLPTQEAPPSP